MGKLSPRQERFVREYMIDLNATQAAIRAGYSARTARQVGSRLLAHVDISAAIQRRRGQLERRLDITQERILTELAKVGFADITDYVSWTGGGFARLDLRDSDEVDGAALQEISVSRDGTYKIRMHDKLAALDKLGKHLGLFDRIAEGPVGDEQATGVVLLPPVVGDETEGEGDD